MQIPELIDIHCHILPKIDDGSKSMEQTMNMVDIAYRDGIRKIICTPHYHIGRAMAQYSDVDNAIAELKQKIAEKGMEIELYAGCEIYYFSDAMDMLESGQIHTMAGGSCILLEFDPMVDYNRIKVAVDEAVMNGYIPIIAHVERYLCMVADINKCEELKRKGAKLQINAQSALGDYGKEAQKYTKKILKKRWVSFVASDAHSDGHRRPVLAECYKYVAKKCDENYAHKIFYRNPLRVIENRL